MTEAVTVSDLIAIALLVFEIGWQRKDRHTDAHRFTHAYEFEKKKKS